MRSFLSGKVWFIFTLLLFLASQSILNQMEISGTEGDEQGLGIRVAIFSCRCFIYLISMGGMIFSHGRHFYRNIKNKEFVQLGVIKIPAYLSNWQMLSV